MKSPRALVRLLTDAQIYGPSSRSKRMVRFTQDEFEANYEEVECRECGALFNIGAQMYYSNLCPSCHKE